MTRHFSEADLLETYYTQPGESMPVMMHLAQCADCAAKYDGLDRKLREAAACSTDKPESFWARQRHSIMHRVGQPRSRMPMRFAAAAVLALVIGFAAYDTPRQPQQTVVAEEAVPSDPWESEELQPYEGVVEWETWIENEGRS